MKPHAAPQAQDLMVRNVQTIPPDLSLAEAIEFFHHHRLSNAPVVEAGADGQPMLIGFLSEGDCLEYLSNEVFFGAPAPPQTVRTMMKRHPICIEPTTDVFTMASIFVSHRHRRLPVVESGRLVGLVNRRDVLKSLDGFYQTMIQERDFKKFPPDLHEVMNLRFVTKRR